MMKYTEKQLVQFGNYLLSSKRDNLTSELNKLNVTHADIENFKHKNNID